MLPSKVQARLLGCVEEHARLGDEVLAGVEESAPRAPRVSLYVERLGSEIDRRGVPPAILGYVHSDTDVLLRAASLDRVRADTWRACVTRGWIEASRTREIVTPCLGVVFKGHGDHLWTVRLTCVEITDDGRIALGLWRQREFAAPVVIPRLEGQDREIVALAHQAERLGFRLAPTSNEAKATARRLKREGWVTRGRIGASTSSVLASPMGQVEVDPDSADRASQPRSVLDGP